MKKSLLAGSAVYMIGAASIIGLLELEKTDPQDPQSNFDDSHVEIVAFSLMWPFIVVKVWAKERLEMLDPHLRKRKPIVISDRRTRR